MEGMHLSYMGYFPPILGNLKPLHSRDKLSSGRGRFRGGERIQGFMSRGPSQLGVVALPSFLTPLETQGSLR